MKQNLIFSLFLLQLLMTNSCINEDINIDPTKAIIGKWEIVENTYGPVSYPGSYQQYLPDSVLLNYNSEDDITYSKYWFKDSLLFKQYVYIEQDSQDTILVDIQPYKFEFLEKNKLKLELQQPAMVTLFIYNRKN